MVEFRRSPRDNERNGRRISDGRAWFDGTLAQAIASGWLQDGDGLHVCPTCRSHRNLQQKN